jgi:hypothetical protein
MKDIAVILHHRGLGTWSIRNISKSFSEEQKKIEYNNGGNLLHLFSLKLKLCLKGIFWIRYGLRTVTELHLTIFCFVSEVCFN